MPLHVQRVAALAVAMLACAWVLLAQPAFGHEGHQALPDGFRAQIAGIEDAEGGRTTLEGIEFDVVADGTALTVTNATDAVLEVTGEQAVEPLVRLSSGRADVNERSPQAATVQGATVDASAVAELLDLIHQRAEPRWVALPAANAVTFMDHRATLGHAPVRADYDTGEVAGAWSVRFSVGGVPYTLVGEVVAVAPAAGGPPWVAIAAATAGLIAVLAIALNRRSAHEGSTTSSAPRERVGVS
jgi:hypothetical protein